MQSEMDSIKHLLDYAKSHWPNFHVTKENIQRPTPEFVLNYYTNMIKDFEEQVHFPFSWQQIDQRADMEPEEIIFLKMQKFNEIFDHAGLRFLIGDIYEPIFLRSKHFMYMGVHLLTYLESFSPTYEKTISAILKMHEDSNKLIEEKDEMLNEIAKCAKKKADLSGDIETLQRDIEEAENNIEKCRNSRVEKGGQLKEQNNKLERLKMKVEEKTISVENLRTKEKQCMDEVITEEEYLNLKSLQDTLQKEIHCLETDYGSMEHLLSDLNEILDHYTNSGKAIPDNFNVDLVNKQISMEKQIEDLKMKKEKLLSEVSSCKANQARHTKLFKEAEKKFLSAKSSNESVLKGIQQESNNLTEELQKYNSKICNDKMEALSINRNLKNETTQLESDLSRFREHFRKEYTRVTEAEEAGFRKFKDTLEKFK